MQSDYLTAKETAAVLKISIEGLRKMRRERRGLPYYKRGRGILYKRSDIHAFLEGNRVEPVQ